MMMRAEPARLEVLWQRLLFCLHKPRIFRDFARRLNLSGDERVMDYMCGMGGIAFFTAKRLSRGQLVCVDASQRLIKACRRTLRRYEGVDVCLMDEPRLESGSFDLIYTHFTLYRLPPDELTWVMERIAGWLKPGGMLLLREPMYAYERLKQIKLLAGQYGLMLQNSRVTDAARLGNVLECLYKRNEEK